MSDEAEGVASNAPVDPDQSWGQKNSHVVGDEIAAINTRREADRQIKPGAPDHMIDVAGLALSGGGVRSAALCLGVLQSLNHCRRLPYIDYLSTVSGGGYIGSSLSATMHSAGQFVFGNAPDATPGAVPPASEISDTPAVGHLRNYSNYLIPAGGRDLLTGIAIIVRGLVANLSLTLPIVLLLAAITVGSNPGRSCFYAANLFGIPIDGQTDLPGWLDMMGVAGWFVFTGAGVVAAILAFLAIELFYAILLNNGTNTHRVFAAYVGGTAVTLGIICDVGRHVQVQRWGWRRC